MKSRDAHAGALPAGESRPLENPELTEARHRLSPRCAEPAWRASCGAGFAFCRSARIPQPGVPHVNLPGHVASLRAPFPQRHLPFLRRKGWYGISGLKGSGTQIFVRVIRTEGLVNILYGETIG